jgi:hypothetical protein
MNEQDSISWEELEQRHLARRNLIRGAVGAGLLHPNPAFADNDDDRAKTGRLRLGQSLSPFRTNYN